MTWHGIIVAVAMGILDEKMHHKTYHENPNLDGIGDFPDYSPRPEH